MMVAVAVHARIIMQSIVHTSDRLFYAELL